MGQPIPALIEVDKIDIEDGFNPRTTVDEDKLAKLADSLDGYGIVSAPSVRPGEGDRYIVVAGHRRVEAAKLAGVEKIPALIRDGSRADALAASLVENLHQEAMNPIDKAAGIQALAQEWELTTQAEIADKLDIDRGLVGLSLRLLKLPEGVQRHIAAGDIPVDAEPLLREVAKVSPRIAECVCDLGVRKRLDKRDFLRGFNALLRETADARFPDKPAIIPIRGFKLSQIVTDKKKHAELTQRFNACQRIAFYESDDPEIDFGDAEVDAARAATRLIEITEDHGEWVSTDGLITDAELAADLAALHIERLEKVVADQDAAKAAEKGKAAASPEEEAAAKEERKAAYREREEKKGKARKRNDKLGRNLLEHRTPANRRRFRHSRIMAVAAILLADNPRLAGRGLRLVRSQLQDVEIKKVKKTGGSREKVDYASDEQCAQFLWGLIESSRNGDEALELLIEAILAAILADDLEVPGSKRIYWSPRSRKLVEELLADEIKAVKPRQSK